MTSLKIFYSLMVFSIFIMSCVARFLNEIDLGTYLIIIILEMGFLALINKEEKLEV